jgi:hypothetical protein
MKLSEFQTHLQAMPSLTFVQPNGAPVPAHFHITEAGLTTKQFVDCGGTMRTEKYVSFQLWVADDLQHRLSPSKLNGIINSAMPIFGKEDLDVEVEYQGITIGRFGLDFDFGQFLLTSKQTNCLAQDQCGIPQAKPKIKLSEIQKITSSNSCAPGSNCC